MGLSRAIHSTLKESMSKSVNDQIKGGKADSKNSKDFDSEELKMGIIVESEHTKDKKIAEEIARDHLSEDPKYYSKLKQCGLADELQKSEIPTPKKPNVKLNPEHGATIANAYHEMKHDPNNPKVKESYGALIHETKQQFHKLVDSGMKFTALKPGQENPYKTSKDMHHDIKNNKHLWYFPTEQGFGSDAAPKDHPMLSPSGIEHNGKHMLANDVFRVVHDVNGHHIGGESGFGPTGEHQAFLTHKKQYSPAAHGALFSETAGQNNWVNFGPHGEHNRKNPGQTRYADQKAGLMPEHIVNGSWHSGT